MTLHLSKVQVLLNQELSACVLIGQQLDLIEKWQLQRLKA